MAEELVEATPEMAARFDHDDAGGGDVESEGFEEDGVGALVAQADDDDRDPVDVQRDADTDIQRVVGVDAPPSRQELGRQRAHRGLGGERFGKFVAAFAVELRREAVADAVQPRLGGEGRVVDDADQGVFHAGFQERLKDPHGVAAPAAAGIIGDIGEHQSVGGWVFGRFRRGHGVLQRGQRRFEFFSARPAGDGDFLGQCVRGIGVGRGDDGGQAVERRIGEGETAHHRHVQHPAGIGSVPHAALAEVDEFPIRAIGRIRTGQHRNGWRDDRQPDISEKRFRAADQPSHDLCGLGATRTHVEMRVGAVADKGVHQFHIGGGHVGMQVVAGDDRDVVAPDAADHGQQRALGVVVLGGQAGAVQHAVDAIECAALGQISLPIFHQALEETRIHRAIGFCHRQQARHWLPGAGGVHVGDETGQLAEHRGGGKAGVGEHGGAAHEGAGLEVLLGGDRCEAVALDGKAQERDARRGHNANSNNSAIRGVAFKPLPVRTSTVVCSGVIVPVANNFASAAAACAAVGST